MKSFVFVLLLSLLSCNNEIKNKETLNGKIERFKKIILPKNKLLNRKQLKIVTYINGDCYACVKELEEWKEWLVRDSINIQFLFIYESTDTAHFNSYIKKYFNIEYPLVYDNESEYLSKNNINKYDKMFQTFLLDKNDSVILVGNPFLNKKLAELYRKEIEKRAKRQ